MDMAFERFRRIWKKLTLRKTPPDPGIHGQTDVAKVLKDLKQARRHDSEKSIYLRPGEKISVMVDLTPLRPGGSNGGLKPAVIELLRELGKDPHPFAFIYLTSASAHDRVRRFARDCDLIICVREDLPWSEVHNPAFSREFFLPNPAEDLPRQLGVDICYCPFGAISYFAEEIPVISLIADLIHLDWPFGLDPQELAWRTKYIGSACARASLIQSISRAGSEKITTCYGLEQGKVFYTYLPIHQRLTNSTLAHSTEKKGNQPYFFYPANFWPHKNHELLFMAYNIYLRGTSGSAAWDLYLTGHADERMEEMRQWTRTLGIEHKTFFHGHVRNEELASLYAHAGCLVFPSLHEGFGIPPLEAWHHGIPAIVSGISPLTEIGGDACTYVNPKDPQSIAEAMTSASRAGDSHALKIKLGKERLSLFDIRAETAVLAEKLRGLALRKHVDRSIAGKSPGTPLLELPSPMDSDLWTLCIKLQPNMPSFRFSIHLDSCPFGSHQGDGCEIRIPCRPAGRRLQIFSAEPLNPGVKACTLFSAISYTHESGKTIRVFGESP